MNYIVPLLYDSRKQPVGLFSATTTAGELVVVFASRSNWDRFASAVSSVLRRNEQYLGSAELEADSFEAVVDQLASVYPEVLGEGTFIPDSAAVVQDIIRYFEAEAGG